MAKIWADRLPLKATGRTVWLGLMVGGTMRGLRWVQTKLRAWQAAEGGNKEGGAVEG
jgi:hypothetical protein